MTLMSQASDFQDLAKMKLISVLQGKSSAGMPWKFLHTDDTHSDEPGLGCLEASSAGEMLHYKTYSRTRLESAEALSHVTLTSRRLSGCHRN